MVITINGATFTLDLDTILIWALVGLVAGFLASHVALGHGLGLLGDIAVGIIGAFIGGVFLPRGPFLNNPNRGPPRPPPNPAGVPSGAPGGGGRSGETCGTDPPGAAEGGGTLRGTEEGPGGGAGARGAGLPNPGGSGGGREFLFVARGGWAGGPAPPLEHRVVFTLAA